MGDRNVNEYVIQITSGRGPEECWRVVAKVLDVLLKEAKKNLLATEVIHTVPGNLNGTLLSASLVVKGNAAYTFIKSWKGTVQWISQSPYRKYHKRKNWFVGVEAFDATKALIWSEKDVTYERLRSSGPGGQHVNKTESAIRARHIPSGIAVVASERRSQHMNKSEALERLKKKVAQWNLEQLTSSFQHQWQQHNELVRGNPVRVFEERL